MALKSKRFITWSFPVTRVVRMRKNGCKRKLKTRSKGGQWLLVIIFLLSLVNKQSRSHGCLLFSNDCLRKANDFQFHSYDSLLLYNDSVSCENNFSFRSHGYFTATSWLRSSERLVVGNVFAWEVTFLSLGWYRWVLWTSTPWTGLRCLIWIRILPGCHQKLPQAWFQIR